MTNNNRSQIELEVQRRVCDALAGAGLSEGSLSREVVYMLPDPFIRSYIRLFNASLKEGVVGTHYSSPLEEVARVKTGPGSYGNRGGTSNHPFPRGAIGEGGKRYRTYWTVLSEQAFFVKKSVDRKLRRLSAHIEDDMKKRTESVESSGICAACHYAVGLLADAGLTRPNYCPQCGEKIEREHDRRLHDRRASTCDTNRPIA
jgi:hypothetical protein